MVVAPSVRFGWPDHSYTSLCVWMMRPRPRRLHKMDRTTSHHSVLPEKRGVESPEEEKTEKAVEVLRGRRSKTESQTREGTALTDRAFSLMWRVPKTHIPVAPSVGEKVAFS